LEHIPARERALARLVAAARTGGWVVVEDVDFGGAMASALARYTHPPDHAALVERLARALDALFAARGADASFGARLPGALREAGLTNVAAELRAPFGWAAPNGISSASACSTSRAPAGRRPVTAEEVARFVELTAEPRFGALILPMVTAWGQRPAA
jgi:hypothetical protein